MIATDPYLQRFVQEFTETNNGKAFLHHWINWVHLYLRILKAEKERRCIKTLSNAKLTSCISERANMRIIKNNIYKNQNTRRIKKQAAIIPKASRKRFGRTLSANCRERKESFPGILGYEDTVIPDMERAFLSQTQYSVSWFTGTGQNKNGQANDGTAG